MSIVLAFLGELTFNFKKRLQTCVKNYLPMCTVRTAFQSKTRLSGLFKFKDRITKNLCSHIFCVVAATQLIMDKLRDIFFSVLLRLSPVSTSKTLQYLQLITIFY